MISNREELFLKVLKNKRLNDILKSKVSSRIFEDSFEEYKKLSKQQYYNFMFHISASKFHKKCNTELSNKFYSLAIDNYKK